MQWKLHDNRNEHRKTRVVHLIYTVHRWMCNIMETPPQGCRVIRLFYSMNLRILIWYRERESSKGINKYSEYPCISTSPFRNSAYLNLENRDLYSNPDFGQGILDSHPGMKEIPRYSNKSQKQFEDKNRFPKVFQCHFCDSYQRNLNGQEFSLNSRKVPFKCNECSEMLKSKEKIQTCPKIAEYCENSSALKVPKKSKPLHKRFPRNVCIKRFLSRTDLERHILTHTGEKPKNFNEK
ncbi:hypothetical protein CDAR_380521 [Caerostris darwini]|uniref:C2H2-type domain-containing protein n=1 Tax=Caerostris darwini TaxID=1538125 RepID=A0AAV4Q7L4_9ARAC|nr:hypothetical protein CDAR_380521 [Caerostris darwini]